MDLIFLSLYHKSITEAALHRLGGIRFGTLFQRSSWQLKVDLLSELLFSKIEDLKEFLMYQSSIQDNLFNSMFFLLLRNRVSMCR